MDNQEPQVEPQPAPETPVEVAETKAETSESEHLPEPPKIEHKFFEVGDEASRDAFREQVNKFCNKMDFQSMCNEAAMVSGVHRNYVAAQATLEVMRTSDCSESKVLPKLPIHYNKTLRTCVNMYANACDDIIKAKEIACAHPLACLVVYSEGIISMYEAEEYIKVNLKDELLERRNKWVSEHGRNWLNYSVDVIVPGHKGTFIRIILHSEDAERPFEVCGLDKNVYPMYTTEEQTKWVDEFVASHKDTCDPEPTLPPPESPDEYEWKNGNRRNEDHMYDGKYMFKSGVIKLRVVSEIEADGYDGLEKWREEYCKFLEGIARKFDVHVLDHICDEEFIVPPNVLRRDDIQKYLSVPTYKHLPGAKLVFLIHSDGGTIIIYNHEKMLTGTCDVQHRGCVRVDNSVV